MKRTFAFLTVLLFYSGTLFAQNKLISDSLVSNLDCGSLSVGNILKKIQPAAFSDTHHLPLRNWEFRSGSMTLAVCWGLSSAQRKLFYLQRLNDSRPNLDIGKVYDMIRGATLHSDSSEGSGPADIKEYALKAYSTIPVSDRDQFISALLRGGNFHAGSRPLYRNLEQEVQRSQELHFFRFGNVGMGLGKGPQSPRKNIKTADTLAQNLSMNRLTLLNLRESTTFQHIVIAKSFVKDAQGNMWIQVYDSNLHEADQLLYFDRTAGQFYGQAIMGTTSPLGVFIVDEKERGDIETALLKHYQQVCKQ